MSMDRFAVLLTANILYRNDLVKKLEIDPNSEYGRKVLNEYLEQERKSDILSARWNLRNNNSGKFIRKSEIISEAERIKNKRLEPYIQKATRMHQERARRMHQEQYEQIVSASATILLTANILYRNDLAKELEIDPNSEYGIKILDEYLEQEKESYVFSAMWSLQNNNPGKFISLSEIRNEAERIKNKRLGPYIQKAIRIHQEQETQEQSGPVLAKRKTPPRNTGRK